MPEHCVKANAITGFEREATGQGHLISRNLQIADHHLGPLRGATVGRQIVAQGVMQWSAKQAVAICCACGRSRLRKAAPNRFSQAVHGIQCALHVGCGTTRQYKRQKQQAPVVFHRSSSRGYPLKRALSRAHQVSAARRLMGKLSCGRCRSAVCSSMAKSFARTVRSKVGTLMPLALT